MTDASFRVQPEEQYLHYFRQKTTILKRIKNCTDIHV